VGILNKRFEYRLFSGANTPFGLPLQADVLQASNRSQLPFNLL
jgi:hypothetical protein